MRFDQLCRIYYGKNSSNQVFRFIKIAYYLRLRECEFKLIAAIAISLANGSGN